MRLNKATSAAGLDLEPEPILTSQAALEVGSTLERAEQPQAGVLRAGVPLYTLTIFAGSSLLFLVQPMFAKLALPKLGGSPAVWNTCVLFFQTTLLLGYLYAHFSTRWLGVRRQSILHLGVLMLPLLVLPITAGEGQPQPSDSPAWWLLSTMTLTVGLPFFVVSTSAPLLQRWFSALPLPSARDPYFLYAASNVGSMIALLGYPFLFEPAIGTRDLARLWTAGFAVFVVLTAMCAVVVRRTAMSDRGEAVATPASAATPLSVRTRIEWVVLAFIPSSLMLGVTMHISTDVAAVPLLWVLPLAAYLATFALAFTSRELLPHRQLTGLVAPLAFACLVTILINLQTWWMIPLHLVTFFVAAMVFHRELARRRPDVHYLTEFYIWMSVGGVLGGLFNSLVAPVSFSRIIEYPLILAVAAQLRLAPKRPQPPAPRGLLWAMPVLAIFGVIVWLTGLTLPGLDQRRMLLGLGFLLTLAYMFALRPSPFAAMALLLAGTIGFDRPTTHGNVVFEGRSFFGVHRVIDAPDQSYRLLQHGSTNHGRQEMPAGTTCKPSGYYHPLNPIGQVFRAGGDRFRNVGVTGLGSGGLACYARAGDRWTFYEIDAMVEEIARDPRYFSFLQNTPGQVGVVIGDGRLTMAGAALGGYDLIVLDAFSSDGVPVHLMTREAMQLYVSRLRPEGLIVINVSNRFLDLEPVLGAIAAEEGLSGLANADVSIPDTDEETGRFASHWVVLARADHSLDMLRSLPGWRPLEVRGSIRPWTDDYSNIFQVLRTN